MDAKKEYDAKQSTIKAEQAVERLSQPMRNFFFLPLILVLEIILYPFFYSNIEFGFFLSGMLNPVALVASVVLIFPSIKLDKENRQIYQALCAPAESINLNHIDNLFEDREKTLYFILSVCAIGWVLDTFYVNAPVSPHVAYACMTGNMLNVLSGRKHIMRKLEKDMAAENTAI